MEIKIYQLVDPRNNEVRYVGKTQRTLTERLSGHMCLIERNYKRNWIKSLINDGLKAKIELLEICEESNWQEREKFWISFYKNCGARLTNLTDGGQGNQNQYFSKKSQKKKSNTMKLIVFTQERRRKISQALTGKKVKEETKQKLRIINLGKIASMESKLKKSKSVIKMTLDGKELETYYSICEAARINNCSKGAIQNVCVGRSRTSGGFKWKYK